MSYESEYPKPTIKNIKKSYNGWEKFLNFYNNYIRMASEAKYKSIHGEGLKKLTSKEMLQRLAIALAQVKAGNTSEILLNEIR